MLSIDTEQQHHGSTGSGCSGDDVDGVCDLKLNALLDSYTYSKTSFFEPGKVEHRRLFETV